MEPNISIVTAFFDIGRETWEGPNIPHYLKRTTEEYFQRFEKLLTLENDIVVYTSSEFKDRFVSYQQQKSNLKVEYLDDWRNYWYHFRKKIANVFHNPEFYNGIQQPWNPEYWSVDYLMVNFMKSWFVVDALGNELVDNEMVAWIDFGYAREHYHVPTECWNYNFDPNKIHFFTIKRNVPDYLDIRKLIETNNVFIMGCHIVASRENWQFLYNEIQKGINYLLDHNMIDDDQTVLYICYVVNPEKYEIHKIDPSDWFVIFRQFNNDFKSDSNSKYYDELGY